MKQLLKLVLCISIIAFSTACDKDNVKPEDTNTEEFVLAENPLFVSPDGNDDVSYEDNDIDHPWKSPQHAWLQAQAGNTVYFREGTYNITESIRTSYANDGTAEAPILFTNYKEEVVVITGNTGGESTIHIDRNYHYINGLTIIGDNFTSEGAVINVAWNRQADHFKITNSIIEINSTNSYDNVSSIRLQASRSNFAQISNCVIKGEGGTVGVQMFRAQAAKIYNNEISNCQSGIYLKHSNALDTDPELANHVYNNYFHEIANSGVYGVFNYSLIQNNLLIDCGISFGDDGGMGDGYVGADYNTISDNTIYGGAITFVYQTRTEDPNKGCLHNVIKDNIITNHLAWHQYRDIDADIQSDYNLYPEIGDIITENRIAYTLTEWQAKNNSDANSLTGTPVFINNSPTGIADFELAAGSPGKNKASDGTDIGADISKVGIDAGGTTK